MAQDKSCFAGTKQKAVEMHSQDAWLRARGWGLLTVLVSTVYPRAVSLGAFPHMDEGFYAYWAQFVYQSLVQGQGLPDAGGFMLYPLLLSWLCALPGNTLVWLRLGDMLAAAWAGWLFCRLLVRESQSVTGGILLALAFLTAMNRPAVIDEGFKNSIFAAYIFLLLALELVRERDSLSSRWFIAGILTALGVLLREPFAVFAVAGAAAVWAGYGMRALWRYVVGGCLGGILVLALVGFLRGGVAELIQSYVQAGAVYGADAGQTWSLFVHSGLKSLIAFWPLLLLTMGAAIVFWRQTARGARGRAWFWLAMALLPLLEPLSKIGFVYHFAVALPGCAGLCALGWSKLPCFSPRLRRKSVVALCLAWFIMFLAMPGIGQARMTLDTLRSIPSPGWPEKYISESNTLLAGKAIRAILPPGGSLSISGFMFFLYPVTGALPPCPAMSDLSRTFIFSGYDPSRFGNMLRENPPDVLVIAETQNDHSAVFTKELQDAVAKTGLYVHAAEIPVDKKKDYGWIGCTVYRRTPFSAGQTQLRSDSPD